MPRINFGRLGLGAVAAGVVANVCDFVIGAYIMPDDTQRMAQRLSLDPNTLASTSVFVTWTIVDFIYAALIVFTYAAIRPRFGPGPATAILAAFLIYAGVTSVLFGFQSMGIFTFDTFVKSAILQLGVAVLTGLTGGALYRED